MRATRLIGGKIFDGNAEELTGAAGILFEGNRIKSMCGRSVGRPEAFQVVYLSDRTGWESWSAIAEAER
jgi:hypothetical protein